MRIEHTAEQEHRSVPNEIRHVYVALIKDG